MARTAAAAKKRSGRMSDEHKAALSQGRDQGRVVRRYLEALETRGPRQGRRRTADSSARRITFIDGRLADADPLTRLHLVQERMDLERVRDAAGADGSDLDALETKFVAVAATYGERKGAEHEAWRAVGVEPRVLKAGIGRGR